VATVWEADMLDAELPAEEEALVEHKDAGFEK